MAFKKLKNNIIIDKRYEIKNKLNNIIQKCPSKLKKPLNHLKRNRDLYEKLIILLVLCLVPEFLGYWEGIIVEVFNFTPTISKETLILPPMSHIFKPLTIFAIIAISLDIAKTLFNNNFKKVNEN